MIGVKEFLKETAPFSNLEILLSVSELNIIDIETGKISHMIGDGDVSPHSLTPSELKSIDWINWKFPSIHALISKRAAAYRKSIMWHNKQRLAKKLPPIPLPFSMPERNDATNANFYRSL